MRVRRIPFASFWGQLDFYKIVASRYHVLFSMIICKNWNYSHQLPLPSLLVPLLFVNKKRDGDTVCKFGSFGKFSVANLIPDNLCSQVTCTENTSPEQFQWKKRPFLYFPSLRKWEILTLLVHLCCIIELSTVARLTAKKNATDGLEIGWLTQTLVCTFS